MNAFKLFLLFSLIAISGSVFADNKSLSLKQKLLMQGPVIQGHADFEAECDKCHSSFDRKELTNKCLDCHEEIKADRKQKKGFHGISPTASKQACESCHADHKGRDADILGLNKALFNHMHTNFTLDGAHQSLACVNCHKDDEIFRDASEACVDCHKQDDVHKGGAGEACDTCHQPTTWQKIQPFDHNSTDFELVGIHQEVPCMSCHIGQKFEFKTQNCVDCHLSADRHAGANGTECGDCHTENKWSDLKFDHSETDFPLLGMHEPLPCRACHTTDQKDRKDTPKDCQSCHKNDDAHFGLYGNDCASCHVPQDWGKNTFNHNKTDFKLTGKHKRLDCSNCHVGSLEEELSTQCIDCHTADNVHKRKDMEACVICHNTSDWNTTEQFDHEFSSFPLIGLHAIVPCENCHQNNNFGNTPESCVECHEQDDTHKGGLGNDCAQCHNPNQWNFWQFDHNSQTSFALEDAHEGLTCNSCHLPGTKPQSTPSACVDCHANDDIHKGSFGYNCENCHNTKQFSDVIWFGN